ncbi:MAG: hypothetical protein H0X66_08260 [Verrucomicrobia bacterium]|nr:hypothetical protein [Verrucomicrobiota bacterium]
MKICLSRFNIILLLLCCSAFTACQTTKQNPEETALRKKYKNEKTLLQLHLGGAANSSGRSIEIYRQKPIYVSVDPIPFLDWRNITDGRLVEDQSGFAIQLQFDAHGTFVLDTLTTANRGKPIAILAITGTEQRWLGAPLIHQRNASGFLTFTPDATREETERMIYGIRNVAERVRKQTQF